MELLLSAFSGWAIGRILEWLVIVTRKWAKQDDIVNWKDYVYESIKVLAQIVKSKVKKK